MRMRGIQCFILAPIKGHEFRRACNAVGGQFIRIAPGSPHCINIMEIRHTIAPEMELIDAMDYVELGSMLANKIQQLMIFFSLLIPDMTNEEEQLLTRLWIKQSLMPRHPPLKVSMLSDSCQKATPAER